VKPTIATLIPVARRFTLPSAVAPLEIPAAPISIAALLP
jgi:hypothetical protein